MDAAFAASFTGANMKNSYFNTPRRSEDCTFHSWADPIHYDEQPSWRKDPDTLIMGFCAAGFIFMVVYLLMGK